MRGPSKAGLGVVAVLAGAWVRAARRTPKTPARVDWSTADIPDLTGQVVVVTGANAGLGSEASKEMARKGATVVLACRSVDKAEAALSQLRRDVPDAAAEIIHLDLASLKSIHQFAEDFKSRHDRLDVLLNNAGIMFLPERRETEDGFEQTFGTNVLGHFALTGLLLDVLEASPQPRVVNVSSFAHTSGEMEFDDLMAERKAFNGGDAYATSKLAAVLFTNELQRRFERTGMACIAVAVDPGFVRTDWLRHQASGNRFNQVRASAMGVITRMIGQSVEVGALALLRGATDPQVRGGEFYHSHQRWRFHTGPPVPAVSSEASHNETDARALWEAAQQLTGVHYLETGTTPSAQLHTI